MALVRQLARSLLAATFVVDGVQTLRHPAERVADAEPVARQITKVTGLSYGTEQLVRANAAAKVAGGVLLAAGKLPRTTSAVLAATLVPSTLSRNRFWETDDPSRAAEQRSRLLTDLAVLGGLLVSAMDTGGRPSLAWRARRAAKRARRSADDARHRLTDAADALEDRVEDLAHDLGDRLHVS
jgi:putative oxidoreductase